MRKNIALLSLCLLALPFINSCGQENFSTVQLSYGRVYNNANEIYKTENDITYNFFDICANSEESFILIVYNDKRCSCYVDFKEISRNYLFEHNINTLTIDVSLLTGNNLYGYTIPSAMNYPSLAIFKNGRCVKQVDYKSGTDSIFNTTSKFTTFMDESVIPSKLNYISQTKLDTLISQNAEFMICFKRTTCGDCQDYSKLVLKQYANTTNSYAVKSNYFYLFDQNTELKDISDSEWITFKDNYGLSDVNNTELGYSRGYVPTIQARRGSEILGMDVYLNDSRDSSNKIISTYFTEEMVNKQAYLYEFRDKNNFILMDKIKTTEEIYDVHNAISTQFLSYFDLCSFMLD